MNIPKFPLNESYKIIIWKLGDIHSHTLELSNTLTSFYEAWNKPEKVKEWQAKLAQIEDFEE